MENQQEMSTTLLFLLLIKHSICDLALQGRFTSKQGDKKNLTDIKGYLHAGDHAIGTFLVSLLLSISYSSFSKTIFLKCDTFFLK